MNCFYLYSSELVSLGSFSSKRLNLYFEQLYILIVLFLVLVDNARQFELELNICLIVYKTLEQK